MASIKRQNNLDLAVEKIICMSKMLGPNFGRHTFHLDWGDSLFF